MSLFDTWFFSIAPPVQKSFLDIRFVHKYLAVYSLDQNQPLISAAFLLDENVNTITRKVGSLSDAFSTTGRFPNIFYLQILCNEIKGHCNCSISSISFLDLRDSLPIIYHEENIFP